MSNWQAPQPSGLNDIAGIMQFGRWYDERVRQISDLAARGGAHKRASLSLEAKLTRIVRDTFCTVTGTDWARTQHVTDRYLLQEMARAAIRTNREAQNASTGGAKCQQADAASASTPSFGRVSRVCGTQDARRVERRSHERFRTR